MAQILGNSSVGEGCLIDEDVIIGYPTQAEKQTGTQPQIQGAAIGRNCVLRAGGVIYSRARLGDGVRTGHHYLVREDTSVGDATLIGSGVIIDNQCHIGARVSLQSMVYLPTNTIIGDRAFLGPRAALTNDRYPIRTPPDLRGPTIEQDASVGAGALILPGITVGQGAMVAAGAVVTRDVPPWKLAVGVPARIKELPPNLKVANRL